MSTTTRKSDNDLSARERRVDRRLEARNEEGLVEALAQLRGTVVGGRYELGRVYAIGGQGIVFDASDLRDPARTIVAKMALLPLHRSFDLSPDEVRRLRYALRVEGQYLMSSDSPFMAEGMGVHEFQNTLLDAARGDAFSEPEPALVMEKLPGQDLDKWMARVHARNVPSEILRKTVDRITVNLAQALTDLRRRGMLFADLRPGNLRIMGRPRRRIRLMDAGSLVSAHDQSGRFPHVPAYLPPAVFAARESGARIVPSDRIEAVMAGRTLFEVATGRVPLPGQDCDLDLLYKAPASPPVAEAIASLCKGLHSDTSSALRFLQRNANKRVRREKPKRTHQRFGREPLA